MEKVCIYVYMYLNLQGNVLIYTKVAKLQDGLTAKGFMHTYIFMSVFIYT